MKPNLPCLEASEDIEKDLTVVTMVITAITVITTDLILASTMEDHMVIADLSDIMVPTTLQSILKRCTKAQKKEAQAVIRRSGR